MSRIEAIWEGLSIFLFFVSFAFIISVVAT